MTQECAAGQRARGDTAGCHQRPRLGTRRSLLSVIGPHGFSRRASRRRRRRSRSKQEVQKRCDVYHGERGGIGRSDHVGGWGGYPRRRPRTASLRFGVMPEPTETYLAAEPRATRRWWPGRQRAGRTNRPVARNVCFDLTRAFNRTRPTAILASGQAVVYYDLHPEQGRRRGDFARRTSLFDGARRARRTRRVLPAGAS